MRLCIAPRWGAGPDQEWYPWLRAQPAVTERFSEVIVPAIDNPKTPTVAAWIAGLTAACGAGAAELANTWFVGHSVGCQGVLRYLAALVDLVPLVK